ncbi:MAG: hypothetical protein JST61_09415 [Acidobacteria bacterium]|nr:hypothetical protein [Acidobacteriota bacterium]
MTHSVILDLLTYLEPVLSAVVLFVLLRSKAADKFSYLVALLSVRVASSGLCLGLMLFGSRIFDKHFAYKAYFYTYWGSYAVEAVLSLMVVYSIFNLAMAPLKGLQTLGMLVFRWVAAISLAVACGVALSPHLTGTKYIVAIVTQLQQTSGILTLCLLLFVTFAIRPMGLSYRSRIFGVSFGLGVLASANLVQSAWLSHYSSMNSQLNTINGVIVCVTLCIWSAYFAFPEEKRRLIVLPTTSPFLRWNQISMVLGDEPGYVAIGGVPPELFAPAELEMMRRASAKMVTPQLEAPVALHSISA